MCQSHKQSEESKKFKSHTSLDSRRNTFSSDKYPSAWYTNTNTWYKNHNCRAWTDSDESGIWVKKKTNFVASSPRVFRAKAPWPLRETSRVKSVPLLSESKRSNTEFTRWKGTIPIQDIKSFLHLRFWEPEQDESDQRVSLSGLKTIVSYMCWSIFTVLAVQKKYIFTMPYVVVNLHYDFSKQKPKIRGKRWRWGVYAFCV